MSPQKTLIFIYGPPGSGKSSLGSRLAEALGLPFIDLDERVESRAEKPIPEIFAAGGEARFRDWERNLLEETLDRHIGSEAVIALGGGALVNPHNRSLVSDHGAVLCLDAASDTLLARLRQGGDDRPLLSGELASRLSDLMERRRDHYASFPLRLDTDELDLAEAVWRAQVSLGRFRVAGMGEAYDVRVKPGGIDGLGAALRDREMLGPVALVSDANVGPLYLDRVQQSLIGVGYQVITFVSPAGEKYKNLETTSALWASFLNGGLERGATVVALGGGMVTDLAGFAAATYMRGLDWVALPTSLLGMVDASLGGKTGIDLQGGKNLVGAFHSPRLVLADPETLATLPPAEFSNGMAEVVKHGVIADEGLFEDCISGLSTVRENIANLIPRAMAVKIEIIQEDPYEGGRRAALNLGHTVGHAVESLSGFHLQHGEAIAIGMVAEARLAEHLGLAEAGIADRLAQALASVGLPTRIPKGITQGDIISAMEMDKKRSGGSLRFALPVRIGEVRVGLEVSDPQQLSALMS